ncbi:MAG: hypothetical protein ACRBN8_21145 [Nannocystales bacterium]
MHALMTLTRWPRIALAIGALSFSAAMLVYTGSHDDTQVSEPLCAAPAPTEPPPPEVTVFATMQAVDPDQSLATVYTPSRGTWTAGVGDTLSPGMVVTAIDSGHVSYARGEATGVLLLDDSIDVSR